MRYLILAALLLSPWAIAEVPDYVGRSLNKTIIVDGPRRYTVPGGNGTRYVYFHRHRKHKKCRADTQSNSPPRARRSLELCSLAENSHPVD